VSWKNPRNTKGAKRNPAMTEDGKNEENPRISQLSDMASKGRAQCLYLRISGVEALWDDRV
jgi:hypothetical protein